MAGLVLQVIIIVAFIIAFADYMVRYLRSTNTRPFTMREGTFFGFLTAAVVLILARCLFRCYELKEGYTDSDLITDEPLFIGLEGM